MLAGGAFAVFFGGNLLDGVAAMLISLLICILETLLQKQDLQRLVQTMLISFLVGVSAFLTVRIGIGVHVDKIMMGAIMLLIPGIAITNSIRDMLFGDTISGILRLVESILMACTVAVGFAMSILLFRSWYGTSTNSLVQQPWIQVVTAALGALGFGIDFTNHPSRLPISAIGGGMVWLVYLVCLTLVPDAFLCCAIAATFGAIYAEVMARISKAPTTVFTTLAEIALIPGGNLYLTMYHVVIGNQEAALSFGALTVSTALAIALGIVLVAAFTNSLSILRKGTHRFIG